MDTRQQLYCCTRTLLLKSPYKQWLNSILTFAAVHGSQNPPSLFYVDGVHYQIAASVVCRSNCMASLLHINPIITLYELDRRPPSYHLASNNNSSATFGTHVDCCKGWVEVEQLSWCCRQWMPQIPCLKCLSVSLLPWVIIHMWPHRHIFVGLGKIWCYPYRNWPIQPWLRRDYLNHSPILSKLYIPTSRGLSWSSITHHRQWNKHGWDAEPSNWPPLKDSE